MLSSIAFTCVAFVTGALAWWGPQFIFLGLTMQPNVHVTIEKSVPILCKDRAHFQSDYEENVVTSNFLAFDVYWKWAQ